MFAAQSLDPDASLTDINVLKPEDNPTDTVSCISWSPNVEFRWFACSDWDSKIRVYDVSPTNENGNTKGINQKVYFNTEEPCLSVAWQEDLTKLYAGCIDNTVKSLDMMTGKPTVLGHHDAAVKDVYWVPSLNVVCSLSFDKAIKFWDARQSTPTMVTHLNFKPYCSDFLFPNLAIGMSEEKIAIIDLLVAQQQQASLRTHEGLLESPLGPGVQISAISFFSGGSGIGTATYEGRANLSTIENSLFGSRLGSIMTFKCHKSDNPPVLYPVHSIGFNPRNKFFLYTAGGEGSLIFWDYEAKSKIKTFSFKGVPVTKAKSSPDGMYIAYALGYDWARGVEGSKSIKSKVCVHSITQDELVYKPR